MPFKYWSLLTKTISRHKNGRPLLKPKSGTFYSRAIYNPAAITNENRAHLLFRAEKSWDNCTGRIGLAVETRPLSYKFSIFSKPILWPEFDYECFGCEDPRITKIRSTYIMTYTGFGKARNGRRFPRVCLATSKDLKKWEKHGPIFDEKDWYARGTKPGGIVPHKLNGSYIMHFSGENSGGKVAIGLASSRGENFYKWRIKKNPILSPKIGGFDSKGVEPGPTATISGNKITLIYNGWNEYRTHRPGIALFHKENPSKLMCRGDKSFAEAETKWETKGMTWRGLPKKIIFAAGYIERGGKQEIYYGASDLYVCLFLAPSRIL
ncbi:MAG: hypothetical protein A3B96_00200 [Candidatus Spechtbacteria bacterium RIFCSPHIGHO2_02_FULL_43_15b]|uniref:Glycosyl hydrolase family 32 N-terminal domain-containing protein n=1 Tax=Candidatus Spechtbacteria bacterium RIFCSPHIGHO2_01_FULL_43_30 TaxID=1802158 RepID=A0A1G2H8W1_9BACT|nr:MAG: hypothetical protein A2827_02535 [Candidatus Spechtbacteria bacterium RIFCSPHIGHO2_01_FULL_43_30]OGZ58703.1 MAG: hypothetical protein A3B96_00200 [Candidatus Spechtbacteria bacterium RIFCSPHIGHO2_02_FULL_43_15b]